MINLRGMFLLLMVLLTLVSASCNGQPVNEATKEAFGIETPLPGEKSYIRPPSKSTLTPTVVIWPSSYFKVLVIEGKEV